MSEIQTILGMNEVLDCIGVSKNTLYQMVREGRFPQSVQISAGRIGWRDSDVARWFEQLTQGGSKWPDKSELLIDE